MRNPDQSGDTSDRHDNPEPVGQSTSGLVRFPTPRLEYTRFDRYAGERQVVLHQCQLKFAATLLP